MAHNGLRLITLGSYRSTDGLRIIGLPEMKIEGATTSATVKPGQNIVFIELERRGEKRNRQFST